MGKIVRLFSAKMGKNDCIFNDSWIQKYPFLKQGSGTKFAYCKKCKVEFSVAGQGITQVDQHVKTKKHKRISNSESVSSKITTHFPKKTMGKPELVLAAKEATFAYHTIKHRQSYRSMDCTSVLVRNFFEKSFSCARTKCEAIVSNVLYPHVQDKLSQEINQSRSATICFDASNQREIKLMPVLVRYFSVEMGVCVKILEISNLHGETAEEVSSYVLAVINQNNLSKKIIAISADNTNTNFGGSKRNGKKNVFHLLQKKMGTDLIGIGCAAHIIHNSVKAASDILPLDVEIIIGKIFQYFKNFTVRVEKFKEFCEFCDVEYHRVLGYSNTRWLALLPALERVLKLFEPLKSYFLSIEKCPVTLKKFFSDSTAEFWLLFVHSQSHMFDGAVEKVEGEHVTVTSVAKAIEDLKTQLSNRLADCYLPLPAKTLLRKLEDEGLASQGEIITTASDFYTTAIDYLEEWAGHLSEFVAYDWLNLTKEIPMWKDMEEDVHRLVSKIQSSLCTKLDDNKLYDQISKLRSFVTPAILNQWKEELADAGLRWAHIFRNFKETKNVFSELLLVAEYFLCLPGTNASAERVFSRIFGAWTDEKSQLAVQSLRAMVCVDYNLKLKCGEFYDYVSKENKLLKDVHSWSKYNNGRSDKDNLDSDSAEKNALQSLD